jgi:hypothetical protein
MDMGLEEVTAGIENFLFRISLIFSPQTHTHSHTYTHTFHGRKGADNAE